MRLTVRFHQRYLVQTDQEVFEKRHIFPVRDTCTCCSVISRKIFRTNQLRKTRSFFEVDIYTSKLFLLKSSVVCLEESQKATNSYFGYNCFNSVQGQLPTGYLVLTDGNREAKILFKSTFNSKLLNGRLGNE